MRLAWFTPWPPDPSGIAGRSAELVPMLAARGHAVDIVVDETRVPDVCRAGDDPPAPRQMRVQSAHDFLWRHRRGQYDLTVYQVGNSRLHEYLWPYLWHVPGLVVLHDARLHHARGRALLSRGRAADYRAELTWSEPGLAPSAAELAIAGFDGRYFYQWPMTRAVVESARLVAVHAGGALAALQERHPDRPICHIRLGEGLAVPIGAARREAARHRLGFAEDAVVFGAFGGLTAERRIHPILRAFRALRAHVPGARLLLAGHPDPALDLTAAIGALDLGGVVTLAPGLDDQAFDEAIAVVDVSLNLRWPSALETSGPWLRALAAGRPTVIVDLPHQAELPALDPRTWQLHPPAAHGRRAADAIATAIDIMDEEHSLRRAMRRLALDADLRAALGRSGRAYWEAAHTVGHMADDYEAAMARAAALPSPAAVLPPHLRPDPMAHAGRLAAPFAPLSALPR
jgi:glycosyltransferase involved in cell wall biosynthesis